MAQCIAEAPEEDREDTPSSPKKLRAALRANAYTLVVYAGSIVFAPIVYHVLSDKEFSAVLTFGVLLQLLGLVFLTLQQQPESNFPVGFSAQTLSLYAVALVARLSSTLWLNGYLPLDRTGDYIYQMADVCTLVLVLRLQKGAPKIEGPFDTRTAIILAIMLAVCVHPSLDNYLFFDVAWATGLYLEAAALLPHLFVETRSKISAHAVAALFCSRALGALFWYHGFEDVAPRAGVNYPGWAILGAYAVQLLLLGELMGQAIFGPPSDEAPSWTASQLA